MLLRIFKTSQPLSWIIIILLLILSRATLFSLFFSPNYVTEPLSITSNLTYFLGFNYPVLSHILSLIVIIPTGFLLNKIAQNVNLFKGIHYLLFMFFGLFTLYGPYNLVLTPFLLGLPLVLFSLAMILTQGKGEISLATVYNASFLIGLSTLIFLPNIIVFAILISSVFYVNSVTWRAVLVAIIGMITPWIFHDVLLFSFDSETELFKTILTRAIVPFSISNFHPNTSNLLLFGLLAIQVPSYFSSASKAIVKIRKPLILMLFYVAIGTLFNGVLDQNMGSLINVIAIPTAIIFTSFQLEIKRWWLGDLVFISLLGAIFLNYWVQ
ncbi:MAG: hypothetical protein ACI85Q_002399 [Salibacteraceae bacterium]|jgi:hypothetical protein